MVKKSANLYLTTTFVFVFSFAFLGSLSAQTLPQFIAPLDIPLILSGNFGEFRGSHFHTGIDIKTQGVEGFPVLAAADGDVVRIKVSPWGYGNALYIEHKGGSMTVYAHLSKFHPDIDAWLVGKLYSGRTLGYDARPSKTFHFAAGDTIGWSGNSGSSGGPHLHFEIRDPKSHPVNPLLWGLDISDTKPPQVGDLILVPVDNQGLELRHETSSAIAQDTTSLAPGVYHMGVEALDKLDDANNKCGIYKLEIEVNGLLHFSCTIDTLDFAVNKDMNAHAYFPAWSAGRKSIHRIDVLPGNRLSIYDQIPDYPICIVPDSTVTIKVNCYDANSNLTTKMYHLRGDANLFNDAVDTPKITAPANHFAEVALRDGGLEVVWPKGSFYSREQATISMYDSVEFSVGPLDAPLAKSFIVSISAPTSHEDLWVARSVDYKGRLSGCIICDYESGQLVFSTRTMGRFKITRDTVPPRVLPKHSATPLVSSGDLVFHVEDAISGVAKVTCTIDGEWVLLRWDPKKKSAIYLSTDSRHKSGVKQVVEIVVEDGVGLKSSWKGSVVFP
jgi:hypothetical protein